MSDPRDYKLDLAGMSSPEASASAEVTGRPYLGVKFACCGVYVRIYRNPEGTAYRGACPKCGKPVNFAVGPGGTSAREFVVY